MGSDIHALTAIREACPLLKPTPSAAGVGLKVANSFRPVRQLRFVGFTGSDHQKEVALRSVRSQRVDCKLHHGACILRNRAVIDPKEQGGTLDLVLSAELDACIANCLALNVVWIGLIAAQPLMRDKEGVMCFREGMEMLVITDENQLGLLSQVLR